MYYIGEVQMLGVVDKCCMGVEWGVSLDIISVVA